MGYDSGGWFWQTYSGNNGAYHTGARVAAPGPGVPVTLRLEWNGTSLTKATANGVDLFGTEPLDFSAADSSVPDRIAIKAGRWGGESADLYLSNVHYTNQATQTAYSVAGKVLDETGAPIPGATVQVGGNAAATDETGAYVLDGAACLLPGTYEMSVSAEQYQTKTVDLVVTDADLEGQDVSLAPIPVVTLSTDALDIVVDTTFPRVIRYTVKGGSADGKVLYGQTEQLDTITINGIDVRPVVTAEPAESGDRIAYTMAAVDEEHDIDCVVYAELVAEGKTLSFNIERIDNALDEIESPVERISIPDHNLISVRSDQAGAALIGNRLAANTITSGDFRYAADELGNADGQRFIYGFVYNDEVSAGIASNSEWGADGAASNNHRVIANAEDRGSHVSLGLSSSEWYYDRRVSSSDADPTNNAVIPDAQKAVGPTELPLYARWSSPATRTATRTSTGRTPPSWPGTPSSTSRSGATRSATW